MGLLAVLMGVLIILLLMIFADTPFTPGISSKIENRAQNAVNAQQEKTNLEQQQLKRIENP